jgi:cytochrome c553
VALLERAALTLLGLIVLGVAVAIVVASHQVQAAAAPTQPIAFSHAIHAGVLGTDGLFCHRNADQGDNASVPSVQQCMFCHQVAGLGNPEVEKVREAAANNTPIDWTRVYRVPDHVHFKHEPHIRAGVACQTCHGPVETMEQVTHFRNLRMGDCISCHRAQGAPTECSTCHY